MSNKRTILVIGASGNQGGSVARHLMEDGTFTVRAMVRGSATNAQSLNKIKNLIDLNSKLGCALEVADADLNDTDSMVKAMEGCYGVFAVTNFWDPSVGYDGEIKQGKNVADACKLAGVQHVVFSTLDRNSDVPHFESKVIVEDYMKSLHLPLTCLVTSFYFENLTSFFPPKLENEEFVFTVAQKPTTLVPMYSVYDTGGWVLEAFDHPKKYLGCDIVAVSQYLSYPELVATFTEVTGKKARFNYLPLDVFKTFGFPGCEELACNLKFFDDINDGLKEDRRCSFENSTNVYKGETWKQFLNRTKWTGI